LIIVYMYTRVTNIYAIIEEVKLASNDYNPQYMYAGFQMTLFYT